VLALWVAACFTSATFFGAMYFLPFFGAAAALDACRADEEPPLACSPLVFPCTMVEVESCEKSRIPSRCSWAVSEFSQIPTNMLPLKQAFRRSGKVRSDPDITTDHQKDMKFSRSSAVVARSRQPRTQQACHLTWPTRVQRCHWAHRYSFWEYGFLG
jgi:hypothetical protein